MDDGLNHSSSLDSRQIYGTVLEGDFCICCRCAGLMLQLTDGQWSRCFSSVYLASGADLFACNAFHIFLLQDAWIKSNQTVRLEACGEWPPSCFSSHNFSISSLVSDWALFGFWPLFWRRRLLRFLSTVRDFSNSLSLIIEYDFSNCRR